MAQDEIHYLNIGTQFERTVQDGGSVVDISSATTKEILLKPPTGTTKAKAAAFTSDGTDGVLAYTTVLDDLDEVGTWQLQVHIVIDAGDFYTDVENFIVYGNL